MLCQENHDPRDIMTLLFLLARYWQKEDISFVFKALINGFERTVLIGKTFSATFAIIILSLSLSCRLFPSSFPESSGLGVSLPV